MFANLQSKTIAIGALLVGVAAALLFHFYEVSQLRRQNTVLTSANAQLSEMNGALKSANATCAALTREQNKQVQALQDAAREREQAASAAVAAARTEAAKEYDKSRDILKRAPLRPGDACKSLDLLFNDALGGRK